MHSSDFDRFRPYLHLLARVRHRANTGDSSDLVQQTLLEAYTARGQFRGTSDAETAGWLAQILYRNVCDQRKSARAAKRDHRREQSADATVEFVGEQSSPSAVAAANERAEQLASALALLPEAQREALVLQHWHGLTIAAIGEQLGRSPEAVAGLLKRGLRQLREHFSGRAPDFDGNVA
jgi:RNA polymerase sigma-70 factor (ECF subfamily)